MLLETHSDHVLNGIRIAVRQRMLEAEAVTLSYFTHDYGNFRSQVIYPQMLGSGQLDQWPEEQIKAILCQGNPRWMKEVYENGDFLKPISVRYFAVDKPKSEGWLGVPGASASK